MRSPTMLRSRPFATFVMVWRPRRTENSVSRRAFLSCWRQSGPDPSRHRHHLSWLISGECRCRCCFSCGAIFELFRSVTSPPCCFLAIVAFVFRAGPSLICSLHFVPASPLLSLGVIVVLNAPANEHMGVSAHSCLTTMFGPHGTWWSIHGASACDRQTCERIGRVTDALSSSARFRGFWGSVNIAEHALLECNFCKFDHRDWHARTIFDQSSACMMQVARLERRLRPTPSFMRPLRYSCRVRVYLWG